MQKMWKVLYMSKFSKLTDYSKKDQKIIIEGARDDKIDVYVKHSPTGALIPITNEAIQRVTEGETLDIEEAERTHDRFYFKLPFLAIRWGMDSKQCLGKLMELEVPCFFNPNDVPINNDMAQVSKDDICVFKEYVDALEEKIIQKVKDVQPEYT